MSLKDVVQTKECMQCIRSFSRSNWYKRGLRMKDKDIKKGKERDQLRGKNQWMWGMTNLSLGRNFNKKTRLTKNLTLENNKKIINYLTNQVENLKLVYYNEKIKNLPNSIKKIEIKEEEIKIRKPKKAKIKFI